MNHPLHHIFLVGLLGVGKSTVGRFLSRALMCDCIDTDKLIESKVGVKIPLIFEYEGEAGFRQRETEALQSIMSANPAIIATGGGLPTIAINRQIINNADVSVIYLHAKPEIIFERTRHDNSRPLLQVENRLEKIISLYNERDKYYREVADYVIESSSQPAQTVMRKIIQILESDGSIC